MLHYEAINTELQGIGHFVCHSGFINLTDEYLADYPHLIEIFDNNGFWYNFYCSC